MVSPTFHSRVARVARLGAALLSLVALGWMPALAQAPAAAAKKPPRKFAPEFEAKFQELLEKLKEEKTKDEGERMKKELENVVNVTGIEDSGQKALQAPAKAAIESAVKDWLEKSETMFRTSWNPELNPEIFDQWLAQASMIVRNGYGTEYEKAADLPAWKEALAKNLDVRQAAAWKADVEERERKFDEQIKNVVAASRERAREQCTQSMLDMASTIALIVSLDDERKKKLEKLGEQAADKASESIKGKTRKLLLNYDEARRNQVLKTNSLYIAPDENDAPDKQEVWKEGLKQILNAEEMEKWNGTTAKRRERRVRAMAQVLVWTFDQAVAFTTLQRAQLLPIASELIKEQTPLFSEYRANMYSSINMQYFYTAATQARDEDLLKILDAKQLEHWRAAANLQGRRSSGVTRVLGNASTEKEAAKNRQFEPEELEAAISAYLFQLASREQDRSMSDALLRVEDAVRIATVDGKAVQRLQTAARGAAEQEFEAWKTSISSSIRSQVQNSTPADVQRLAANAGYYSTGRRRKMTDDSKKSILDAAFAAELSEAQRTAWQKEVDARKDYEQQVIAASIIGELDRMCLLTEDQWNKLEPMLAARLKEYSQDFGQMFSSQEAWFLQSYYMLTPVAGIPEKDMRTILTDAQWKQWSSSNQFSNCSRYWENIESNHKSRVRTK